MHVESVRKKGVKLLLASEISLLLKLIKSLGKQHVSPFKVIYEYRLYVFIVMLVFYSIVHLTFKVNIHLSSAFHRLFLGQAGTSGANVFFYSAPCLHFVVMMKLPVCRSAPAPS